MSTASQHPSHSEIKPLSAAPCIPISRQKPSPNPRNHAKSRLIPPSDFHPQDGMFTRSGPQPGQTQSRGARRRPDLTKPPIPLFAQRRSLMGQPIRGGLGKPIADVDILSVYFRKPPRGAQAPFSGLPTLPSPARSDRPGNARFRPVYCGFLLFIGFRNDASLGERARSRVVRFGVPPAAPYRLRNGRHTAHTPEGKNRWTDNGQNCTLAGLWILLRPCGPVPAT